MVCSKCKKITGILYLTKKIYICELCEFEDEIIKKVEKQVKKTKKKK